MMKKLISATLIVFIQLISIWCVKSISESILPNFELPKISFNDLLAPDKDTISKLSNAFIAVGIIQVTDILNYAEIRRTTLSALPNSLKNNEKLIVTQMNDGATRITTSSSSTNGIPGSLNHPESQETTSKLRSLVDQTSKLIFRTLDLANDNKNNVLDQYSFQDIIHNGDHLEHFHVFYPSEKQTTSESEITLDMHTDNGLMIAMTPGYYNEHQDAKISENRGLYIELSSGIVKAKFSFDSLIFMVGEGGEHWLSPVLGKPLHAVKHALVADVKPSITSQIQSTRAWYGLMILPPADAIITVNNQQILYQTYRENQSKFLYNQASSTSQNLPVSCEFSPMTQLMGSNCFQSNGDPGIECWARCMSYSKLSCGSEAFCFNVATSTVITDGFKMCHPMNGCELECEVPTLNSTFAPTHAPTSKSTAVPTIVPTIQTASIVHVTSSITFAGYNTESTSAISLKSLFRNMDTTVTLTEIETVAITEIIALTQNVSTSEVSIVSTTKTVNDLKVTSITTILLVGFFATFDITTLTSFIATNQHNAVTDPTIFAAILATVQENNPDSSLESVSSATVTQPTVTVSEPVKTERKTHGISKGEIVLAGILSIVGFFVVVRAIWYYSTYIETSNAAGSYQAIAVSNKEVNMELANVCSNTI